MKFANEVTKEGLISKICTVHEKKKKQLKNGWKILRHFSKEDRHAKILRHFFKEDRHANGQEAHEKMLNIANY